MSNDERGVENSDSSLDFTSERDSDELAMPSTVEKETKFIHLCIMSQQPPSLSSVLRPEPAVRDSKHTTSKSVSWYTQIATIITAETTAEEIEANGVGRLASPAE